MEDTHSLTPFSSNQNVPLYMPKLQELVAPLQEHMAGTFKNVKVQVVDCPDLTEWGLVKPGISSQNQSESVICDVGGVPNLLNPAHHSVTFSFPQVATAVNLPKGYVIGACAACPAVVGSNAECIPCYDCGSGARASQFAKIAADGAGECAKYDSSYFGLLGNFYVSEGVQDKVLKIEASNRIGVDNYISCIRKGLCKIVSKTDQQIGMGGVFSVDSGMVMAHIMPDFKKTVMIDGPEVGKWLRYFEMGPNLTCLTSFLTADPTGGKLDYRLEHTHFFSRQEKEGGHYHFDTTESTIKYIGYFALAGQVFRLRNSTDPKL